MTYDDEGSLFDEEYDFVDEDEEEVEEKAADTDGGADEEAPAPKSKRKPSRKGDSRDTKPDAKAEGDENVETAETEEAKPAEAAEPPGPPTDHVVHLYEFGQFTRTLPREFTTDDAVAFAVEFNRTSAVHSRHAVAANREDEPATTIS